MARLDFAAACVISAALIASCSRGNTATPTVSVPSTVSALPAASLADLGADLDRYSASSYKLTYDVRQGPDPGNLHDLGQVVIYKDAGRKKRIDVVGDPFGDGHRDVKVFVDGADVHYCMPNYPMDEGGNKPACVGGSTAGEAASIVAYGLDLGLIATEHPGTAGINLQAAWLSSIAGIDATCYRFAQTNSADDKPVTACFDNDGVL